MGHKVHPKIHRTQVIYTWDSRWFSKKNYALLAEQDLKIREYLMKNSKMLTLILSVLNEDQRV